MKHHVEIAFMLLLHLSGAHRGIGERLSRSRLVLFGTDPRDSTAGSSASPGIAPRAIGQFRKPAKRETESEIESVHVESLDHIHIYAAKPEESARFYQQHFEAKPVLRNTNSNGDARIFLALGGQILVIGSFPREMAPATPPEAGDGAYGHGFGVAHFGLRVGNISSAIAELSDSGVRVLSKTVREPSGLTYAYVAAPDGVIVELTQYEPSA